MSNFGKEVKKAMIDADTSAACFAKTVGISNGYISLVLSGGRKICPSFYRHLVDQGLATIPVQIEYALDRRAMDVTGLSREQVTELVKVADGMRKECQK